MGSVQTCPACNATLIVDGSPALFCGECGSDFTADDDADRIERISTLEWTAAEFLAVTEDLDARQISYAVEAGDLTAEAASQPFLHRAITEYVDVRLDGAEQSVAESAPAHAASDRAAETTASTARQTEPSLHSLVADTPISPSDPMSAVSPVTGDERGDTDDTAHSASGSPGEASGPETGLSLSSDAVLSVADGATESVPLAEDGVPSRRSAVMGGGLILFAVLLILLLTVGALGSNDDELEAGSAANTISSSQQVADLEREIEAEVLRQTGVRATVDCPVRPLTTGSALICDIRSSDGEQGTVNVNFIGPSSYEWTVVATPRVAPRPQPVIPSEPVVVSTYCNSSGFRVNVMSDGTERHVGIMC